MGRFQKVIADYLETFQAGDVSTAFHGLLEIDDGALPELIEVFQQTQELGLREFLVRVIWESREPGVIMFLGEALLDEESRIWRQALDGLVALASPASLELLLAARTRRFSKQPKAEEFRRWLEEAIQQTEEAVNLKRTT